MNSTLMASAACMAAFSSGTAFAQNTPADDHTPQVSEIVVTATRREERLQDIPVAVSAFSGNTLAKANVAGASDLIKIVPSLKIGTGSGTALPFLRGVGNAAVGVGNEASVAIYVDGVYFSRLPPAFFEFNSVQRVEVLKGPQGTLFGRNTTGGLIQIITRDPSHDTDVEGNVGYGNFRTFLTNFYATTGFTDSLAGDISFRYENQRKGWGTNIDTGNDVYFHKDIAARTKWLFTPSDATKITFSADYVKTYFNGLGIDASLFDGTVARNQLPPHDILPPRGYYDSSGTDVAGKARTWGVMGKIEQDVNFANLVSITSYRNTKGGANFEVDRTLTDYFQAPGEPYLIKQFTQEIQLLSKKGGAFDWILGGFFLHNNSGYTDADLSGIAIGGTPDSHVDYFTQQIENSYSGFGQGTLHLGGGNELTVGGRYTVDKLKANGRVDFTIPGVVFVPGTTAFADKTFKKLTWKGAFDHKFSDNVMAFVSVSRGFKSGIFNLLPFSPTPAKPEVLDAYEAGIKTNLFDRRLRLNASYFHYNIKDPQVNIYPPSGAGIELINAGKAKIDGVDLDGEAAVAQGLRINFGLTYLHARYTDFPDAPLYMPSPYPNAGTPPSIPDPVSGSANGNTMPQAPKWAGNIGFSYEYPISIGTLNLSANLYHSAKYYFHPDNYLVQPSINLVDAQIGLTAPDERWNIQFWAKNLANERYYVGASEVGQYYGFTGQPAAPRTYGVKVGFKFGSK